MVVILPVVADITMVASVSRPETTAREDARTVMGEPEKLLDGDREAREAGEPVAWGAIVGLAVVSRVLVRASQ